MKPIYSLLLLCLTTLPGFSQAYQRMLIPQGQATEIIYPGGKGSLKALCLDYFRSAPGAATSLDHILSQGSEVIVRFSDGMTPATARLQDLLGWKIFLKGSNWTAHQQDLRRQISLGRSGLNDNLLDFYLTFQQIDWQRDKFVLTVINDTGRPFRLNVTQNIQVGHDGELPAVVHSASNQKEQWRRETEIYQKQLQKIGYDNVYDFRRSNKFSTKQEFEALLAKRLEAQKASDREEAIRLAEDRAAEARRKIEETRQKAEEERQRKEKIAFDKTVSTHFKKFDIGIKANSSEEYIRKYNAIAGKNHTWDEVKMGVEADYKNRIYYIFDNATQEYTSYIISTRIKGQKGERFLFKNTQYVRSNIKFLEEALFLKKINQSNCHILNFLDKSEDKATYEALLKLFPNNHSDFSLVSISKLKQKLKSSGIKFLFCFGHFKEGAIFTEVDGIMHYYNISTLDKIAKEVGVEVIYLGCKSSLATKGGSGTVINVNSIDILNNLFKSVQNSTNLGEFFSNFASGGQGNYNFTYQFEENSGIIRVNVYHRHRQNKKSEEYYHSEKTQQIVLEFPRSFFPNLFHINNDDEDRSTKN